MLTFVIVAMVAYLMGSIPFGYILLRVFRGEDVRASGSGNIGATNVARKAPGLGLATLILDALKGSCAVYLALEFARSDWNYVVPGRYEFDGALLGAVAAICAILGHVYPVWLRFKGGKGVATGVGAFLALAPLAVAGVLVIFFAVVIVSRYVSLGSILATAAFPVFAYLLYRSRSTPEVLAIMCAASALIIVKHKDNIRRLLAGTEHRFQLKHR